jgi:hypothetical protein
MRNKLTVLCLLIAVAVLATIAAASVAPTFGDKPKPAPMILPVICTPNPDVVQGGGAVAITVVLDAAPQTDQTVTIQTDHPEVFADMPATVIVPAEQTSTTFSVQTNVVSGQVAATVQAILNGGQASGVLTVNP